MDSESAFREVNDSIRELAPEGPEPQTMEFFCECTDVECHVLVSLTLNEFDERRAASPEVPILAEHHVDQRSLSPEARV
jgi:hypothetical protein